MSANVTNSKMREYNISMEKIENSDHLAAVVGAGPAGLYAARLLANQGVHVVLFNRDLKPGGLAEYGIYPTKIKAKQALRKQFKEILSIPNITYFGNITIGTPGALRLKDLLELGFQGILVTAGAQGTKRLDLPGEDLVGVYHAKEIVYYYNLLPPYTQKQFKFGKKVAIIGVGNVMMDIARYLLTEVGVDTVTAYARRGPAEIKFDRKELAYIINAMDFDDFENEIKNSADLMTSLGQDPNAPRLFIQEALTDAVPCPSNGKFRIRFLASPRAFLGQNGKLHSLEMEKNTLVKKELDTRSIGTGIIFTDSVDSVVYAIGDKVDANLGLPVAGNEFKRASQPQFPIDGVSYEVEDPATSDPLPGILIAGWARQVSTGQVGLARKDGEAGAEALLNYLHEKPKLDPLPLEKINERVQKLANPVVTMHNLRSLQDVESLRACQLGLDDYKLPTNEEMLAVMGLSTGEDSHKE